MFDKIFSIIFKVSRLFLNCNLIFAGSFTSIFVLPCSNSFNNFLIFLKNYFEFSFKNHILIKSRSLEEFKKASRKKEFQDNLNHFNFLSLPPLKLPSVAGKYSCPSSSIQPTTCTKSATNEGIEHLRMAELPRMTYSLSSVVGS